MSPHSTIWIWVAQYGYPALFLGTFIEGTGIPGPVEVLFFAAGFLVSQGHMTFVEVILVAMTGMLAGNFVGYAVGLYGGRPFVERYGNLMGLPADQLSRAQVWFDRYGGITVAVSRIIGVTRTPSIVAAGVLKLDLKSYTIWSLIGNSVFITFWAVVGTFFGTQWTAWRQAHPFITYVLVAFVIGAIVAGVFVSKRVLQAILSVDLGEKRPQDGA